MFPNNAGISGSGVRTLECFEEEFNTIGDEVSYIHGAVFRSMVDLLHYKHH